MEFMEAVNRRVSVRKFRREKTDPDHLRQMVESAGKAPSINNSQPWKFYAVVSEEKIKEMAVIVRDRIQVLLPENTLQEQKIKKQVETFSTFFADAPSIIAVAASPYQAVVDDLLSNSAYSHDDINAMRNFPNIQTIGAAVQNILLSAVDQGYGACWLTGPLLARNELEKYLGIKSPFKLAAMVAIGKPVDEPKGREKRAVEDIFVLVD